MTSSPLLANISLSWIGALLDEATPAMGGQVISHDICALFSLASIWGANSATLMKQCPDETLVFDNHSATKNTSGWDSYQEMLGPSGIRSRNAAGSMFFFLFFF